MKVTAWIAVEKSPRYPYYNIRVHKDRVTVKPTEVAFKLNLELPEVLFTRPTLEASIIIPEKSVNPPVITAETVNNIQDAIKQSQGIDLRIWVEEKTNQS